MPARNLLKLFHAGAGTPIAYTPCMNEIAQTILQQLGGNRFLAMTGAECMAGENHLQIKLPRMSKASCVVITLESTDSYHVRAYAGRGVNMQPISDDHGIYVASLRRVFESVTGLRTSL